LSNSHSVFFCIFFLCLTAALPAWGRKEKGGAEKNNDQKISLEKDAAKEMDWGEIEAPESAFVNVTGIVRLVGSGLMPETVITGLDREWYVLGDEDHLLKELQYCTVTVEGYETVVELKFANGFPAGERRTLKDIKIIRIE